MNWLSLLVCLLLLAGCGDNRPAAAGAAHIFNSTGASVKAALLTAGGNETNYQLPPGKGIFVPLRRADTYTITVREPASLASYSESITISADDTSDTLFDISGEGYFALVPTFHVPTDMPEMAARGAVERMKKLGQHQDYYFKGATRHRLPKGVYYTFGDDVEEVSRMTTPGREVEIRYKLGPVER